MDYYIVKPGTIANALSSNGETKSVTLNQAVKFYPDETSLNTVDEYKFRFELSRQWPGKGWAVLFVRSEDVAEITEYKSSSSNRVYQVLHKNDEWSCNCPAWAYKRPGKERTCKHVQNARS